MGDETDEIEMEPMDMRPPTDEIEMEPMDMRRPAPSADADRARAKDLRAQLLAKVEGAAADLGNDDSSIEEHAAAKAQLSEAKEVLALRASEATAVMNSRDDRLARAAAAEARGDHTEAAELREGAAMADAQYRGYVTTVAQEQARVDALTEDVQRLDAWAEAAQARALGRVETLSAAEQEIDDLEDRATHLTRAELHDRTSRLYRDEAARLEAEGHDAEAGSLWDAANDELTKADVARQQAGTFAVDESRFGAAELGTTTDEPTSVDAPTLDEPAAFDEPTTFDAPTFDAPTFDAPTFDEPAAFDDPASEPPQDFADAPTDQLAGDGDAGFDLGADPVEGF